MSTKVWIDKKGSTLRLRWLFEGESYQLPLGVKDNVAGNGYAKIIAGTIERDIDYNNFDRSPDRYQNPNKRGRKPKIEISKLTAVELFKAYSEDRLLDGDLSHSSGVRLKGIASKLGQFLGDESIYRLFQGDRTYRSRLRPLSIPKKYPSIRATSEGDDLHRAEDW